MNTHLAPTLYMCFGDYWVLWYAISNSYSIVHSDYKQLLDTYFSSNTELEYASQVLEVFSEPERTKLLEHIGLYLKNCNLPYTLPLKPTGTLDSTKRKIVKYYQIASKTIKISFCSELVLKTIHPALAQYATDVAYYDVNFDIYLKENTLFLYQNEKLITSVLKTDYHHIQGKFMMRLLCTIHHKEEVDWIGTLHGSTITDGHSSIVFVGKSGSGKSTLSALLATHGFQLLADDVSPLLYEDQHIYYNPSAISIKEGAFKVLRPLVNGFEDIDIVNFNKAKGQLKYLPCSQPKATHYPCKAMVLVNYKADSETQLEETSIKVLLETIIEDSWISPNPIHAEQFLNWLKSIKLYRLTYSNTDSVNETVATLFTQL
ncbi:phosphoenolpyruvate carboxykinase (ATP) [Winogradskyella arenosi]|nr:hypothetical protein [Winogradskyella arenosi]